jgi:hypothetical protein
LGKCLEVDLFGTLAGIDNRMLVISGETSGLDFIRDFEREPLPSLAPCGCVAGIVTIKQKCGA